MIVVSEMVVSEVGTVLKRSEILGYLNSRGGRTDDFFTKELWVQFLTDPVVHLIATPFIAILAIGFCLITIRDKAHSAAYKQLSFKPTTEAAYSARSEPTKFRKIGLGRSSLTNILGSYKLSHFYLGVLLDREILIFNQLRSRKADHAHDRIVHATYASMVLRGNIPNFEFDSVSSFSIDNYPIGSRSLIDLPNTVPIDKYILLGCEYERVRAIFDSKLCALLTENSSIQLECIDGHLLINNERKRIYTAKGARKFVQLISDIAEIIEANSALTLDQNVSKSA